jgi:hypothetical protein
MFDRLALKSFCRLSLLATMLWTLNLRPQQRTPTTAPTLATFGFHSEEIGRLVVKWVFK